ncbi:arginine N-succinyltransferase, partial [Pseudomonas syringae pv. tagetis]|uniref:arginine N-succinyltransferase n=1 Tax=Pseudomonas syringae group genomosp. 7 TaxID=251699 RepID=UPI00376FB1A8
GPAIEGETGKIRAIIDRQALVLAIGTPRDDAPQFLIYNRKREDSRVTVGAARVAAGTLVVAPQTGKRVGMRAGDKVRAV